MKEEAILFDGEWIDITWEGQLKVDTIVSIQTTDPGAAMEIVNIFLDKKRKAHLGGNFSEVCDDHIDMVLGKRLYSKNTASEEVYIVFEGQFDDSQIKLVTKDPGKAFDYILDRHATFIPENGNKGFHIVSYPVDGERNEIKRKAFIVNMRDTGEIVHVHTPKLIDYTGICPILTYGRGSKEIRGLRVTCFAENKKQAIGITDKKRLELLERKYWY